MLFSALSITAVDSTGFKTGALQKIKTVQKTDFYLAK